MLIKYHITPITPGKVLNELFKNKNLLISFYWQGQIKDSFKITDNIIFDNGAFTFYRKQIKPIWEKFYNFLDDNQGYKFFFIPDVIDGTEKENDDLIANCPIKTNAIPVFHLHESETRLKKLMSDFEYIALGSSGDYWQLGTVKWLNRMNELFNILTDDKGKPLNKIHMLRCMNHKILKLYPFFSCDSSNFSQNHWKHNMKQKEQFLNYLESLDSPEYFINNYKQLELF